jgi:hypothetical protein
MWKNQMPKSSPDRLQEAKELLAEFSDHHAQLAKALVSLRQEPGHALLHRIQSIPYQDSQAPSLLHQETGGEPMRTNRFFPLANLRLATLRSFLVLTAFLAFVLLLAFSIPATRALAVQAVAEIRQILSIGTGSDGIATFSPTPPFTVKQPHYLPGGFELVTQRYQPGDEPNIMLEYTAKDGQYVQLFERLARPDETLPSGEPYTVRGWPARLQRSDRALKLIWIDEGTWIELEGTTSEAELLRIAESLATTQSPDTSAAVETDEKSGIEVVVDSVLIPPLTLQEAQKQVPFPIPMPSVLPEGLELWAVRVGDGPHAEIIDKDGNRVRIGAQIWIHLSFKPVDDSVYDPSAALSLEIMDEPGQRPNFLAVQEEVVINGHPAIFTFDNHRAMLLWQADDFTYTLRGYLLMKLSKEDYIRIAESIR